jgi:hypothetical protein
MSDVLNNILRWTGWLILAGWLAFMINREFLDVDPNLNGFRAPTVEAEMKNCTSEDMRVRYGCKERAILSGQRTQFVSWSGSVALVFGPPIVVYWLGKMIFRPRAREGDYFARRPPSIKKWRVR